MYRVISSDNLRGETLGEIRILITVYPSISTTKFLNKMVEIKGRNRGEKTNGKPIFIQKFQLRVLEDIHHLMITQLFFPHSQILTQRWKMNVFEF